VTRVVIALSGGVDSAVAAALLVEQGYDVVAVMMRLWSAGERPLENRCCSAEAVDDARRVAALLDIPFYLINYERQFQAQVVDYFLEDYSRGRTPNPCLACNRFIKFDLLLKHAMALDAQYLATGHYCRIVSAPAGFRLLRGVDPRKDQSYMLHVLGQDQLAHILFPLGDLTKDHVRSVAVERGLPVAEKAESQDLCFVPAGDYRAMLRGSRPESMVPGPVEDTLGNQVGVHPGLPVYTVGQRHGLGLKNGGKSSMGRGDVDPLYVVRLEPDRNVLVVGGDEALWHRVVNVMNPTFVSGESPAEGMRVTAKVRYRSPESPATLRWATGDRLTVLFDEPQRAVTPGQAIVFYQGEEVLGGGTIST
jgi:tRNA-uridine 2-sulfurtransferase